MDLIMLPTNSEPHNLTLICPILQTSQAPVTIYRLIEQEINIISTYNIY